MKIYIPNITKKTIGGGLTFRRNLAKGAKGKFDIVDKWEDCDVVLIAGVTIADRTEIKNAKARGKKIVLRIDNMPRDSRNRGTAFSRMRDFGLMADYIVFQSDWAQDYVGWWLMNKAKARCMFFGNNVNAHNINTKKRDGGNSVIYNGVDKDCFYHKDNNSQEKDSYLIVHHNQDENKRVQEAFYAFMMRSRKNPKAILNVVGRFSPEVIGHDFDFFSGENVIYRGVIDNPKDMGDIMRECKYFYFPAFADAAPNTLAEACACGCVPLLLNEVGGSVETSENIYSIQEMANKYLEVFKKLI